MKTLKVRPVLVPQEKAIWPNCIWLGRISRQLRLDTSYNDDPKSIDPIDDSMLPQELVLISLEDEKIEVENRVAYKNPNSNKTFIVEVSFIENGKFDYKRQTLDMREIPIEWAKKVIAIQSQIPVEYISKFIEQYNNGCVEDLEIEMEYISGWSKLLVEKQGSPIKYHIQPKLTKGFVTIIEKELIYLPIEVKKDSIVIYGAGKFHEERLIINRGQAALLFVELYKFLEFDKSSSKEPITYTEEEVILYLQKYRVDLSSGKTPIIGDTTKDWFENNKNK